MNYLEAQKKLQTKINKYMNVHVCMIEKQQQQQK